MDYYLGGNLQLMKLRSFNKIPKKSKINIIKNLQKIIRKSIKRYKT